MCVYARFFCICAIWLLVCWATANLVYYWFVFTARRSEIRFWSLSQFFASRVRPRKNKTLKFALLVLEILRAEKFRTMQFLAFFFQSCWHFLFEKDHCLNVHWFLFSGFCFILTRFHFVIVCFLFSNAFLIQSNFAMFTFELLSLFLAPHFCQFSLSPAHFRFTIFLFSVHSVSEWHLKHSSNIDWFINLTPHYDHLMLFSSSFCIWCFKCWFNWILFCLFDDQTHRTTSFATFLNYFCVVWFSKQETDFEFA